MCENKIIVVHESQCIICNQVIFENYCSYCGVFQYKETGKGYTIFDPDQQIKK